MACLDTQGKLLGRPVSDLLGGRVRDSVPFSAYLFYKWAGHPAPTAGRRSATTGARRWTPPGIVEQARLMHQQYGFRSFKLKGGVFPPDEEIAAIRALRRGLPGAAAAAGPQRRLDGGDLEYVARELDGVLEYLEDPTAADRRHGARSRARSPMPLATNMCVIAFGSI